VRCLRWARRLIEQQPKAFSGHAVVAAQCIERFLFFGGVGVKN